MNEAEINAKGITAIQPELDRIAALQSNTQLPEELARIHRITSQSRDCGAKRLPQAQSESRCFGVIRR